MNRWVKRVKTFTGHHTEGWEDVNEFSPAGRLLESPMVRTVTVTYVNGGQTIYHRIPPEA